jgi:FkbM family methyltransferase
MKIIWKISTNFLRRIIVRIALIDSNFLARLERDLRNLSGKGNGFLGLTKEIEAIQKMLSNLGITNPTALDIGASDGLFAAEFLEKYPNSQIYAFEPSSAARKQLIDRFKCQNQVKVVPIALSSADSMQTLHYDRPGSPLASLTKRRLNHFGLETNHSELVKVQTLDNWVEENHVRPDFIKIDVEGHEYDVLIGGINTLKTVGLIQFEFGGTHIDTRTFFQDFWYLLNDLGFVLYRYNGSSFFRIMNYTENDEYFIETNYLAIKSQNF